MTEITLPKLGNSAGDVRIERYYKQPGDSVEPGDPLVVVCNERFEWDVPATAAGTIGEILARPGATIAAGAALIRLNGAVTESAVADSIAEQRSVRATPVARKIAAAHGLDLATVRGSGPGGMITRADVLDLVGDSETVSSVDSGAASEITAQSAGQESVEQAQPSAPQQLLLSDLQRSIAMQLVQQKTEIPHALTAVEVELSQVLAYVEAQRSRLAQRGIDLSVTACVAHAVVGALARHRLLNSVWSDEGLIVRGRVQLGVATGQNAGSWFGLVSDAADLSLQGLSRALGNRQPLEEAQDRVAAATFTVCDEGGSRWRHAIVPAAQGAILALGAIQRRPFVLESAANDTIVIRPLAILTLAYDARCVAQHQADAFLIDLKSQLEHFSPL